MTFSLSKKILPLVLFNFPTTALNKFSNIFNQILSIHISCQYVHITFIYENNIFSVNTRQNYLLPFFLFPSLCLPLFSTEKLVISIKNNDLVSIGMKQKWCARYNAFLNCTIQKRHLQTVISANQQMIHQLLLIIGEARNW